MKARFLLLNSYNAHDGMLKSSALLIAVSYANYPNPNWPNVLDSNRGSTKHSGTVADCRIRKPLNPRNRRRAARDNALQAPTQNIR